MALMLWFKGENDTNVKECLGIYHALEADVTNLDPYWSFVNCSRRALGMGVWEDAYLEAKDPKLKEFREKGVRLENGITVKILPRYKGMMVDWYASDRSKSAVFWHGEKDASVLRKHWKVQDDNSVFPMCETINKTVNTDSPP